LIFVQIAAGESAESPKRHRLMSYDFKTQDLKEIASSNFFNDVVILEGKVYFAPSSAYQTAGEAGLYRSDVDGSNRVQVLNKEVWNIFRSGYGELQLSTPQDWYDFRVGSQPAKLAGAPANPATRVYIDSPNGKSSLWVDKRDGKGVLLFYDLASKKDSIVRSQNGLGYPIRWLDDSTLIFRMTTESETADYALSLNGGEGRKIADVTNTGGVDKWYYY
jgi:hypothetical protein